MFKGNLSKMVLILLLENSLLWLAEYSRIIYDNRCWFLDDIYLTGDANISSFLDITSYTYAGADAFTPIARTSGGGDIDLVYGENSLLRHAKNKKTLFEPKPISKTCQCRKFEVFALIILSATYHDYNSRRHQVFCSFHRFNSYE